MRLFNSFQLVCLFGAFPALLSWLTQATFPYAGAAFWAALAGYLGAFLVMWRSTYDSLRKDGPWDW